MLEFLRTRLKDSIFVKIFLGILMGSFAIWGIGDFMSTSRLSPGVSIKVGDTEVKTVQVQRRFQRELERFRDAMKGQTIPEEIMMRSVMGTLVQDMTKAATLEEASDKLGLTIGRDQLREEVYKQKMFLVEGKFNRLQFEEILSKNQLTESGFLQLFAADMRQATLMQPIALNAGAPDYLVNSLFQYRSESRVADTLLIPSAAMTLQTVPKDEELKAVYDKNIATFTAPEYRKVTVLALTASDLVKPDSIDDAQAKAYYDDNLARYRSAATKRIAQIVFDSKEKAEAVRGQASASDTLDTLAAKTKSGPVIDLGELTADSPLVKTIGIAAFNSPEHEISQPMQTPLGWHLFEVKSATPESTKSFESVKETIRKTMAADKGADAVYDASVQVEDALASGTPFPEIAKNIGGHVTTIDAIDQEGKDNRSIIVPNLVDPKNFMKVAFETPAGKDSKLMDMPGREGYYVLHVDDVTPPTPKPLIDVRPQVAALWEAGERNAQAQALADKLAANLGPSSSFSAVESQDKRASYAPLGPVTRFGEGLERQHVIDAKRISPDVLDRLFKAKVGDVFVAPVQNGVLVARLKDINAATPVGQQAQVKTELADAVRNDIGSNLMDQVAKVFAERYPAEVDQKTIDSMITTR